MRILLTGNTDFKIANFRAGLVHALIAQGHDVDVLVPEGEHTHILRDMGCRVYPLHMKRNSVSLWHEGRAFVSIFFHLLRHRPDVVFGFTIKNNIYGGLWCCVFRIPFVANVTGLGPAFNRPFILNTIVVALYKVAFCKVRRVFFQNSEDKRVFLDANIVLEQRTKILPGSGVSLKQFDQAALPFPASDKVFLFVARLIREKGIKEFCAAAADLKFTHPNARFQILGPFDRESKSAVTEGDLNAWMGASVEYLGEASDVRIYLRRAHCVVLPSYYKEGTPRSLLEAAAIGRPIITTDLPGCRDVVEVGVTGYLVPGRDSAALAEAMRRVCDMPDSALLKMAREARVRAERLFSEEIIITSYLDAINHVR